MNMDAKDRLYLHGDALIEWSAEWERETGFDSIPTIERLYEKSESGAFCCPFPHCNFRRMDSVAMWDHVHFSAKHRKQP